MKDTVSKYDFSVKSESVAHHHLKTSLNPKCSEFEPYSEHKTAIDEPQSTNSISQNLRSSTSYFIPKSSNDPVKRNNIGENNYSTPHTQFPDMKFVRPETPYPKDRLGIQVNDSSLSIHLTNCIDDFIDR